MSAAKITREATELLKQLISIESFSTQENKTADAIENFFSKHSIKTFRKGNNVLAKNKNFEGILSKRRMEIAADLCEEVARPFNRLVDYLLSKP